MRKLTILPALLALVTSTQGSLGSEQAPPPPAAPVTPPSAAPVAASTSASPIPAETRQVILVRTASWFSIGGTLERYTRDASLAWQLVGESTPVNVGRHGLAWGRGLHPLPDTGRFKKEGDGRSPAGVFALEQAFGANKDLPEGAAGFPYLQTQSSTYCVEDVHSAYYNRIIDSSEVRVSSWQQWSKLLRSDGQFQWGLVVSQNAPDTKVGAGSCVFLHVWRGPSQPTSGCTSMASSEVEEILRWVDPAAHPVLVQLPEHEYEALRADWGLP